MYKALPSAKQENLPVATRVASQVICLPIHHELADEQVNRIIDLIAKTQK
jgi:dTDP-4-amino-4,6-dideoxygalactose transaminase